VIYYETHPDRTPPTARRSSTSEVIHVWVREATDWKLIGAMARLHHDRTLRPRPSEAARPPRSRGAASPRRPHPLIGGSAVSRPPIASTASMRR
jgi:hypothetical protein